MRLQARLALALGGAVAIAILISGAAIWVVVADENRQVVDDQLIRAVEDPRLAARRFFVDGVQRPGRGDGAGQELDRRLFTLARVVGPGGAVVFDDGLPPFVGSELTLETVTIDGERFRMASAPLTDAGEQGVVQFARNIEDSEASLDGLRRRLILGAVFGMTMAAGLGALLAQRLSSPIRRVSEAAAMLAAQPSAAGRNLPRRIEVERRDEIGELAASFNQMLGALEVSRDQQERLIGDASHELRTPLTSLRLKVDLLNRETELPAEQRRNLLEDSAAELERLTDLVNELVALATDPSSADETPILTDLGVLVQDTIETRKRSAGRNITFILHGAEEPVSLRPVMVSRAVSNLLDNAIKYSEPNTDIAVTVTGDRIEVRDHGEGFIDAELEHVFDRFYRSPVARTRPGNGIGLAIVDKVAHLHGGEVWARNARNDDVGAAVGAIVGFSLGAS